MEPRKNTTKVTEKKKTCIFGTSANPPTKGHRDIVVFLATRMGFDEILVLPVYQHMFEQKRCDSTCSMSVNTSSFEDRLTMAQLSFSSISTNVIVSDLERQCYYHALKENNQGERRVGTADLLDFIKINDKNCGAVVEYTLALGSDTFIDLMDLKWKRSKDVIDHVEGRFLVICRPSKQLEKQELHHKLLNRNIDLLNENFSNRNEPPAKILHIPELLCVSSTDARVSNNEAVLNQIIEPAILLYIKRKKLYAFSSPVGGET